MKFLLPVGGVVDHRFGILASPATRGIPAGITAGMPWAADNQAFTQGFDPDKYFPWLESMLPHRTTCLFVVVPDAVGDADKTLELFHLWGAGFSGWPVAFVAQDGLTTMPTFWFDCLFVGGSTEYKLSSSAASVICEAQTDGRHIHIGRVNWRTRYNHFALMEGSEEFTCDGTRTRFDGVTKAVNAWRGYMAQPPLHRSLPGRDSDG